MNIEKRQELERRLVRKLVRTMDSQGWTVAYVNDGGERVRCRTEAEIMDTVFSVDECHIAFMRGSATHAVLIVLGNDGYDAIADYGYAEGDPDGFQAIMEGEIARYQEKLEEEVS